MSNIEVGEYIRTIQGDIGICVRIEQDNNNVLFRDNESCWVVKKEDIKSHSKNIIDLIEERRYSKLLLCNTR